MLMALLRRAVVGWLFQPPTIGFRLAEGAKLPTRMHKGDAGFDLYLLQDIIVPSKGFTDASIGVYLQMPHMVSCRITGRSSAFRKHGLDVREGIIDAGYTGELFVGVHNPQSEDVFLPKGTRIAQIIFFYNVAPIKWQETSLLVSQDGRNAKGFGSTGINGKDTGDYYGNKQK